MQVYEAEDEFVYYCHPKNGTRELFLKVFPTEDCTMTPAEQAVVLARMLNDAD